MPQKRDEYRLSLLSLGIKLGVILLASVSCSKLTAAHQGTRALYRELKAEHERQQEHLLVARRSFDDLFQIDHGEPMGQRQGEQWTVPDHQRVVWAPSDDPEQATASSPYASSP